MIEIKAAIAESTIRTLENILYRYMEDYGYKYIHNLSKSFTTLTSKRNCSIDLISKNIKNSGFVHSVQQAATRVQKTQVSNWRQSLPLEV